tara:strand:+ start:2371 stop:3654 length:1284 start_codon:yes stop_codon:yes gene_type:complete
MAYLGAQPNKTLTKTTSQSFNGTGSATTFTLNRAVNTEEELEVFVENVQQEPGSGKSYTASGTTLTFDEAPPSGTGNIYVIYRGLAEVTTRLEHDANQALAATTGTFSGAVTLNGGVSGDVAFDTDTLKVDSTNNRVGVKTSPDRDLHVKGSSGDPVHFKLEGDSADYARIMFDDGTTDNIGEIRYHFGSDYLRFNTNSAERMRIDSSGNVGIGTTTGDITSDGTSSRTYVTIQGTANRGRLNLGSTASNGADVGTLGFTNGANTVASISVDSDSGSQTAGKMNFATAGTVRFVIESDGQVKITNNLLTFNDVNYQSGQFSIPSNTKRRVRITLSNYGSAYVRIGATRTNGGDTFTYWEGYIYNNNNTNYNNTVAQKTSGNTLSYTFDKSTASIFQWTFNSAASVGNGTIFIQQFRGSSTLQTNLTG